MKFFGAEISRLVVGCNPIYGYAHFNTILSKVMEDYYTPERVVGFLHHCARFGLNAYNFVRTPRSPADWARFQSEGGAMHLIMQGTGDPVADQKDFRPLAIYYHGGMTDRAWREGRFPQVREWCRRARGAGMVVGVGTHKPEVIQQVESEGWDVDFYAGCLYNVTRSAQEWRQVLGGELPEMPSEIYMQSDPPRMLRTLRQTPRPCFAFKLLAAGRRSDNGVDQAFRTAFEMLKPTDGIFVGMFPRIKDEVRDNVERLRRILT